MSRQRLTPRCQLWNFSFCGNGWVEWRCAFGHTELPTHLESPLGCSADGFWVTVCFRVVLFPQLLEENSNWRNGDSDSVSLVMSAFLSVIRGFILSFTCSAQCPAPTAATISQVFPHYLNKTFLSNRLGYWLVCSFHQRLQRCFVFAVCTLDQWLVKLTTILGGWMDGCKDGWMDEWVFVLSGGSQLSKKFWKFEVFRPHCSVLSHTSRHCQVSNMFVSSVTWRKNMNKSRVPCKRGSYQPNNLFISVSSESAGHVLCSDLL